MKSSDSSLASPATTPAALNLTAGWRDYLALTKPRVISLLLFTTLASLYIGAAGKHPITFALFVAVAIGGYMIAGAANTINMIIDQDIDIRMARTAQRPIVTSTVSRRDAIVFTGVLMVLSNYLLQHYGGTLSALLADAGLLFYVVIYTLLLKRRTWHNIVIGGAAGCFPALVGWAAAEHSLAPLAWILFAIVFFWTPVHFWALALLLKDDYAAANIPMLPVVRGERQTVIQIAVYMVLTVIISLVPAVLHDTGVTYLVSAVILNVLLAYYTVGLVKVIERKQALWLFKYSMIYLALLFLMMAIDRCH